MRRLNDFQQVHLSAGARRLEAYVLATSRTHVTLVVADADARAAAALNGAARIQFESRGHLVVLEGRAIGHRDGTVYFGGDDKVSLPEPRRHARLPVHLEATLVAVDEPEAEPVTTTTLDISEAGIRVRAAPLHGTYRVTLSLPGGAEELEVIGAVVRCGADGTALRFVMADADVLVRLRRFVLTVRRGALARGRSAVVR